MEYLSSEGVIYRMDRVSVFKSGDICILDYKTGHSDEKEKKRYESQMQRYKAILKEIYKDKKIYGVVYNIDINEIFYF